MNIEYAVVYGLSIMRRLANARDGGPWVPHDEVAKAHGLFLDMQGCQWRAALDGRLI
jgi:hypothetical protein